MSVNSPARHESWMRQCLRLARKGIGWVSPNPAVGAVLVAGEKVLSEGFHGFFGGPHAEVDCLTKLPAIPRDAVLYVNLEPCTHFGKTPPCVDLIIRAGIRNVVIGMTDPNPLVSGRGIKKLRKAGIRVTTGVLEEECVTLNRHFLKNITTGLPYIHLKVAMSIDGKLAGGSRWVSSTQSRIMVHRARAVHDAVLVGAGTVISDDPRLDVRHLDARNPHVVVLDGRLRSAATARVFASLEGRAVILCTTSRAVRENRNKVRQLQQRGVIVLQFETKDNPIPLRRVCRRLLKANIGSILVEGGKQVSGAFHAAGLVDELSAYIAPTVNGGGSGAFQIHREFHRGQRRGELHAVSAKRVGPDLVISYEYH